jgi:hypothetical protein
MVNGILIIIQATRGRFISFYAALGQANIQAEVIEKPKLQFSNVLYCCLV